MPQALLHQFASKLPMLFVLLVGPHQGVSFPMLPMAHPVPVRNVAVPSAEMDPVWYDRIDIMVTVYILGCFQFLVWLMVDFFPSHHLPLQCKQQPCKLVGVVWLPWQQLISNTLPTPITYIVIQPAPAFVFCHGNKPLVKSHLSTNRLCCRFGGAKSSPLDDLRLWYFSGRYVIIL